MTDIIAFLGFFWELVWFPLIHLDVAYFVIVCPFLLLLVALFFGLFLNLFRRF